MNKDELLRYFIICWVGAYIIGIIRPKIFYQLVKWQMELYGKVTGFDIKPKSEQEVCRKIRFFHVATLPLLLWMLYMILSGKAEF